jgi:hypothetical protein
MPTAAAPDSPEVEGEPSTTPLIEWSRVDDLDSTRATVPAPYTAYLGPGFGDPRDLGLQERADAVVAVVTVEGPVKAQRVYQAITRLAGTRLREAAESALVAATKYAVRTGRIEVEKQLGRNGYVGSTLRMPNQPAWVLRERGPREVDEIPDRELAAAAALFLSGDSILDFPSLAKKVSLFFGYKRSTDQFKEALTEALRKHP